MSISDHSGRTKILYSMVISMDFIVITCVVLLLSVFLIYKITCHFGLHIHFKPLLFCAFYALGINFIQPSFYFGPEQYHWLMFLGAIFVAAYTMTRYNERLVSLSAVSVPSETQLPLATDSDRSLVAPIKNTKHLSSIKYRGKKKSSRLPATAIWNVPGHTKHIYLPAVITPSVAERVKSDMENATLLKLTAVIAKLPSLDSILEYAYDQKRLKAYSNAIFAFKQALDQYESDEYAPFIVIEIGNIYKNSGLYDEAIVIYKRAFSLPATQASEELSIDFQKNISYLRITKTILLQHGYTKLAFHQIPAVILAEIDSEFAHWRKKKYAS